MGVAVNEATILAKDSTSMKIILEQFNSVTPENIMKAEVLNPEPGVYHFKPADDYVAFAEKNGLFTIGHTLIWHNQTPRLVL